MKRYVLFGIRTYYPNGGMGDMKGSFDEVDEIVPFIKNTFDDYDIGDLYWEVYDSVDSSLYNLNIGNPRLPVLVLDKTL